MGEKKEKKSKKKDKEATEESAASAAEEAPPAAAPKKAVPGGNVFALFKPNQIQEFKEAFTMMDQNRDGFIDVSDLGAIYQQIGMNPSDKEIKAMLDECTGDMNFTGFLNLFGANLHGTDPESTLRDAFLMFDPKKTGTLSEEYVKDLLMNTGDQFNKDEIKSTWKEAPIEKGTMDYQKFVLIIKRGPQDE